MLELHSLKDFLHHVDGGGELTNVALQGVDLRGQQQRLGRVDVDDALFLGCRLESQQWADLSQRGALVFPDLGPLPFQPFRPALYSRHDLFGKFDPSDPDGYCQSPDAKIYQHYLATGKSLPSTIRESLARRLHDHSVTDAMHDFLAGSEQAKVGVVAIMGGHELRRDSTDYRKIVEIARQLAAAGYLIVSGGGPGAMEAAHLGAWMVGRGSGDVEAAIAILSDFGEADPADPDYKQRLWLANAYRVMDAFPPVSPRHASLGIPTWLYGHEPPTPFATRIAKYFSNSVREEGLITIAEAGIIFAPGSFGTVQEIFQDAAQNHYATPMARVSPMVFLGTEYWRQIKPVFPLLEHLSQTSQLERYLAISDDVDDIVSSIVGTPALAGAYPQWSFCENEAVGGQHGSTGDA